MKKKKIIVADEAGFCRICSAILESMGHVAESHTDVDLIDLKHDFRDIGLAITSYPYGSRLLEKLSQYTIPIIILVDQMNSHLISTLNGFDKPSVHCMIKPIDYNHFKVLVNQTMLKKQGP